MYCKPIALKALPFVPPIIYVQQVKGVQESVKKLAGSEKFLLTFSAVELHYYLHRYLPQAEAPRSVQSDSPQS